MSDAELNAIFRFRFQRPSDDQTPAFCGRLRALVDATVGEIIAEAKQDGEGNVVMKSGERVALYKAQLDPLVHDRDVPLEVFTTSDIKLLEQARREYSARGPSLSGAPVKGEIWTDRWFPEYAAVLQMECVSYGVVRLRLLGLDGWERVVHHLPGDESVHSAVPRTHQLLHCGEMKWGMRREFDEALRREIESARGRTGNQRSAAHGNGPGHQKTPSFLCACIQTALSSGSAQYLPKGGMTDVGLHTGGALRDTCWPLVCATLRQALPSKGAVFQKTLLRFQTGLLQVRVRQLQGFQETKMFWSAMDMAFAMLYSASLLAAGLMKRGYSSRILHQKFMHWREEINNACNEWGDCEAQKFTLPGPTELQSMCNSPTFPLLKTPEYQDLDRFTVFKTGREAAMEKNRGYIFIDARKCSAEELLLFLEAQESSSCFGNQRAVEVFMWRAAAELSSLNAGTSEPCDPPALRKITTWYRARLLAEIGPERQYDPTARVTAKGKLLLMSWISYCLCHKTCCEQFTALVRYRIPLDWRRLNVAVLPEATARTALKHVTAYIQRWNQQSGLRASVFNYSDPEGTMHFAQTMGQAMESYSIMHARHVTSWASYVDSMWAQVETRKIRVSSLRTTVTVENRKLADAESAVNAEQARLPRFTSLYHRSHLRELQARVSTITNSIQSMESEIATLVKLPEVLISPLPAPKTEALAVLFLTHMPLNLDILSDLVGHAQRELAFDSRKYAVSMPTNPWLSHVKSHAKAIFPERSTHYTVAHPHELKVPIAFGPSSIDYVSSRDHFEHTCTWFPNGRENCILWRAPCGSFVDPFKITKTVSETDFSANLGCPEMQWANNYPGGTIRANVTYALADAVRTANDHFASYVALGSLRCHPVQQLRRRFEAIESNTLDWSTRIVRTIVKQAVFQVGDLTEDPIPRLAWHADLESEEDIERFCSSVNNFAKDIASSPSKWKCIPLMGEISGYLDQFHSGPRTAVRSMVATARQWAEVCRQKWMKGVPSDERVELRSRECLLYGFALICYSFGPLSSTDLFSICELIVLFENARLFSTGCLRGEVKDVQFVVRQVMATHVVDLIAFVAESPTEKISRLCGLVNDRVPISVQWTRVDSNADHVSSCFEAIDSISGSHYLLNLFTGSILTDGSPPGGLPSCIRTHEKFVEVFDDQDFEVTIEQDVYSTVQKFSDCHYRFRLVEDDLVIEESGEMAVLQVCSDRWRTLFREAFPATLVELYSHWFWYNQDCVLLRQKAVKQRDVLFIVKFTEQFAKCYQVPREDQSCEYSEVVFLLKKYDVFVVPTTSIVQVFEKFENLAFIHFLVSASSQLKVHLPHFGLHFVQGENGQLSSVEHDGYSLSPTQRLPGQLHRFRQYLLLVSVENPFVVMTRLLVPRGRVECSGCGVVDIKFSCSTAAAISVSVYDQHPLLLTFSADSQESRLLLAAIYSGSSNLLPWDDLKMTGGQAANELLRGGMPSRPLSDGAVHALKDVCRLSHHTPTSKILAIGLAKKASDTIFHFPDYCETKDLLATAITSEQDSYTTVMRNATDEVCSRDVLLEAEEDRSLGPSIHRGIGNGVVPIREVQITSVPVSPAFVATIEMQLTRFIKPVTSNEESPFPLRSSSTNAMGNAMLDEIKASWIAHCSTSKQALSVGLVELAQSCRQMLKNVVTKQIELWQYLRVAVSMCRNTPEEKILIASGALPSITKNDILRCVLDDTLLLRFAPHFNSESRAIFRQGVLRFMEVCVLVDKLQRIISSAESSKPPPMAYFVEELNCCRGWSTEKHPYWLVFEVEGCLQIRPEQYVIARNLIENPGSVCQLNMGRGKTRVILPMLFLYFGYTMEDQIVRAHFLSPLLSETRHFMNQVLSSGLLRVPIVEFPFNRSIDLGLVEVMRMREAVEEIKKRQGFVLISPEHRLSLELKRIEIAMSSSDDNRDLCDALDLLLEGERYIDIFDDSDALLHYKYHLVYAVGNQGILDGGSSRWIAAEALLKVLVSSSSCRVLRVFEDFPGLISTQPEYSTRFGAYNGITLSAMLDGSTHCRELLKQALVEGLIDRPPMDLAWLKAVSQKSSKYRAELCEILSNCAVSCESLLSHLPSEMIRHQLLALRGLVAHGVLENCLEKRNRVDFGLPNPGTRPKALAIPFTAADLPSERSEFSHPDVSIVLTLLAYYHAGLTLKQVHIAFKSLIRLDESERRCYYREWFTSVEPSLDPKLVEVLRDIDHVSLDNTHQFAVVYDVYRYSMEVINFYLNRHVFPRDTKQYPQRLSRTAWSLVRGPHNIGFSGTNDTHHLLPVGVAQNEPETPSLRGTNGKMMDLMLSSTIDYEPLVNDKKTGLEAMWKQLLQHAVRKKCRALIDTGALLAGVSLCGAAEFLLEQPEFDAQGVTFYDSRKKIDCWIVLEHQRRLICPLKSSTIPERDTFVIFDEARSRGSDMKLYPNTIALLTLGPTITKDKLMQGAGRLRQLGQDQKLCLTSSNEVKNMVLADRGELAADATTLDVLNWVMTNTQRQCTMGLIEWAHNGIQHYASRVDEKNELQDEDWSLKTLYEGAVTDVTMYDVIARQLEVTAVVEVACTASAVVEEVHQRADRFGKDDTVRVTGFGEECERELQIEAEEEVEKVVQCLEQKPSAEEPWDYRAVFSANSVHDLSSAVTLTPTSAAIDLPIAWCSTHLFQTKNFRLTIKVNPRCQFESEGFMRMADVVLVFNDDSVLMLAEGEADAILKMLLVPQRGKDLWARRGSFGFVHLGFALRSIRRDSEIVRLNEIPLTLGFDKGKRVVPAGLAISVSAIATCHLLNGETHFEYDKHPELMERVLRRLLEPLRSREQTLRIFVERRRLPQRWPMSFLHDLAKRMDIEDWV